MSTYRDLISGSLRLLGIKSQGESATGAEAADALAVLNELIDSFNSTGTLLYTTTTFVYPLTTLSQSYTIGPTGQMVVASRPTRLTGAWFRDTSNTPNNDVRLTILADSDYGDIVSKGTQSDYAQAIYLDRQYPNANIYLYPVPSSTAKSLVLQFATPLNANVTLDTIETLPPAYRQMLRFNLAVMIAPEYGIESVSPIISATAMTSRQLVEQSTYQQYEMRFDNASNGVYSINSDQSRI